MSSTRAVAVYRGMLRFYPRRFRDEYGLDMALFFANQLRDEPASRVWARSAIDLAVTVPTLHLEAHMKRPASPFVPMLFGGMSVASALVALIVGTNLRVARLGVAVAVVAGALCFASVRQTRTIAATGSTTSQWWKFLAAGVGGLLAMILAEGATDLDLWMPMIITVVFSLVLIASGLVLGVAHAFVTHSRRATN